MLTLCVHVRQPTGVSRYASSAYPWCADSILFFLSGQVAGDLVVVAMSGDFMAPFRDCFHRVGISFGDAAAGQKVVLTLTSSSMRRIRQMPVFGPYSPSA